MNRTIKVILIVLACLVALVAVAAVGLKLYFTSDRLKALVIPRVEEVTGRDVSVTELSLRIFPRFGLRLGDLTVSNPRQSAFDRNFLTLKELILDVSIWPLLRKELQVNNVLLRQPDLYLEINRKGASNFAMPADTAAKRLSAAPDSQAFSLFLSNFQVNDGRIEFVDKSTDRRILLGGYEQRLKAEVTDGGTRVHLENFASVDRLSYGSLKSFLLSNLPLESYQNLTFLVAQDKLTIDSARIALRQISLTLQGTVDQVQTQPALDLSLSSTKADIEQLLSLVPPEFLKASQGISSSGAFQFALTVKGLADATHQPALNGSFRVENASIRYANLPESISNINLAGRFQQPAVSQSAYKSGKLEVQNFSAALGSSTVTGKLSVADFQNPSLSADFSGEINLSEVAEYYPLEPGTQLSGRLKAKLALSGKAADPTNVKANGTLEFQNVAINTPASQKPLRNLNGVITFNNQIIETKRIAVEVGRSDLALSFSLRNYLGMVLPVKKTSGKAALSASLTSKRLDTADLMPAAAGPDKKQPEKKEAGLLLPDINVDAILVVNQLLTGKFTFTDARGAVRIRNGVINLDNFSLNAFAGKVKTTGKLDLQSQENPVFDFKLDINNVQANALLSNFTSFGQHLFGQFTFSGSMQGALNDTLGLKPKSLQGGGRVQIQKGRLIGYPLTSTLASFTGISELKELEFANWQDQFRISDGRLHLGQLKVSAKGSEFVVNGSQGLDGTLDYGLLVKLPESLSSQLKIQGLGTDLLDFLKDKEGRINLNFDVTGTAADPKLTLDKKKIEEAARQALEQKAREEAKRLSDEAAKKAEEDLKKKAEEELKRLFGK